jgi:predicted aspartyl protease
MTTIIFSNSCAYVGNRPYADVVLNPSYPNVPTHKCLVDTGADYLQLPATAAATAGINLRQASQITVGTASGSTTLLMLNNLPVSIEGYRVIVDVLFDPTNSSYLIAGRQLLLAAFEVGFNNKTWLWT